MSECSICNDTGVTYVSDIDVAPCRCLKARLIKQHLGPEIALAKTILTSPLLTVQDDQIQIDRTDENLFLHAPWHDLLPHLKWALYCKGLQYRFRIVTDEKIRTVFVGAESYMARPKSQRDDVATMNSLADLVGAEFNLLIIRLGFLGHKNVAAPGALKEALMIRESACVPTWLVDSPSNPFAPGCFTYSDDVAAYIRQHFAVVTFEATASAPEDFEPIEDVSINSADPSTMVVRPRPSSPSTDDLDPLLTENSFKKRTYGKKPRGGDPL